MRRFPVILLLSLLASLAIILSFDPNFFLHDDTLRYFLPLAKLQGEILFEKGQLPEINLYQFGGHPLLPQNQNGVLYLPRYLFFLIATSLGEINLLPTIEIACHILLAGLGMYCLLQRLGVVRGLSIAASHAYAFNGFVLDLGRNWMFVAGYVGYLPVLFWAILGFQRNPTTKRLWILVFIRTLIILLGHSNFGAFVFICEALFFVFLRPGPRTAGAYLISLLLTLLIAAPGLLPMYQGLRESARGTLSLLDHLSAATTFRNVIDSFFYRHCTGDCFRIDCSTLREFNFLLPFGIIGSAFYAFREAIKVKSGPKFFVTFLIAFLLLRALRTLPTFFNYPSASLTMTMVDSSALVGGVPFFL